MSTMKERPYRDGLNRAVDIFRDAMRPFIVRSMALGPGGRVQEGSIDVNDFPHIVRQNWHDLFHIVFNEDRTVENALWQISEARNKAVHPGPKDVDCEYVRARLYDIADVLGRIKAQAEKRAVEEIRNALFGRPGHPPKYPEAPHRPNRPRPTYSPDRSSYWLNAIMDPVILHKGTCMYVKKYAGRYPGHWTEYPTKDAADAAGRSTLRRVQDCGICF